jgi:hypothetical protein
MPTTLRALGSTGVVAIYTGDDDVPFTAPLSHLSNGRLKFHSSLDYPKVVQERTVTLSLPARVSPDNGGREYRASYNLFSHGRPGMPWVLASLRLAGRDVAATGSVPVQKVTDTRSGGSAMANPPWARWVSIGATGSVVTAFEYAISPRIYLRYPAINIPITVWVTDESF